MKNIFFYITFCSIIIFNSCSNKTAEYLSMGEEAYSTNNYELALLNWEKVMTAGKSGKIDPLIYAKAGDAALKLENYNSAKEYLTSAYNKGVKTPEVLTSLAAVYRKSDNLSYEIGYLEELVETNQESTKIGSYNELLFDAYVRSENWEKASSQWNGMNDSAKKELNNLNNWLKVQRALKNNEACFRISKIILKQDPENKSALNVQARHYYHKAEALYQREMNAYNSKKTRSQYAKLLKALKLATTDFKVARDHFETLYQATEGKEYAKYLANIYARLSNKQKSDYYKKLSN